MEIDKITTLNPKPNDTIVVSFDGKLTDQNVVMLKHQMKIAFPDNKCVITENGLVIGLALKWTSDLPTQEGWYWHKMSEDSLPTGLAVSKYAERFIVDAPDEVIFVRDFAGEWYGPIEPPEYKAPL